jgi:glutaminyl-peptide cyclotransferase
MTGVRVRPVRQFYLALLALTCAACPRSESAGPSSATAAARVPEDLRVHVLRSVPHDHAAFTQGLLLYDGKLYESTGLLGQSTLRRTDPDSGAVEARVALEPDLFGEGLARVGGRLIQLTWQNHRALVWTLATLQREREFTYDGEGWGLCFDGRRLIMSDGSDRLAFRDPDTFVKTGEVAVRRAGVPVRNLNELECFGGVVYANVWEDTHIARIDPATGDVTGWIDASGLLSAEDRRGADVLNGIAQVPNTNHLLITGKLWPAAFEVEIVPR